MHHMNIKVGQRWWGVLVLLIAALVALVSAPVRAQDADAPLPRLAVSADGHFLTTEDGKPFFWLGDTAWELFARLDEAQTLQYLDNRRDNGFNVIQAAILTEWSLAVPSAEGQVALRDNDPLRPNEAYFKHVDWVIQQAADRGLYVALVATWGDKVNLKNGLGPILFNTTNARPYGEYLGKRYGATSNVIWLLGGDRNPEGDTELAIWRGMGAGIEAGSGGQALISYHPRGGKSSAQWFQKDAMVDFNLIQSGHNVRDTPTWDLISDGFHRKPVKPILDSEINYEEFAIARRPANGYFTEYDIRKQAYRSVFAGGAGVTYGHQSMWQFYAPERRSIGYATTYWYDALNAPGAVEMRYLADLMLSRPYFDRIPDQKLLLSIPNTPKATNATKPIATRASDGSYAFIYLPSNQAVLVDFKLLSGTTIRAWWYDPRTGRNILIGETPKSDLRKLLPPVNDRDWVLVLDDAGRGFGFPGRP